MEMFEYFFDVNVWFLKVVLLKNVADLFFMIILKVHVRSTIEELNAYLPYVEF